jgi:hypothetical protein
MPRFPGRRHPAMRAVLISAALLLPAGTACGPGQDVDIDIKSAPVNLTFGGPKPTPAPHLDIPRTGDGFIVPPVALPPAPGVDVPLPQPSQSSSPPAVVCPTASANAPADESAPTEVTGPPKEGTYTFGREGTLQAGKPGDPADSVNALPAARLTDNVQRVVSNVQQTDVGGKPRISYDVTETEAGIRTTTSYLIDPVGAEAPEPANLGVAHPPRSGPGLKITQIKLERSDLPADAPAAVSGNGGVEVFTPQPPIKIFDLPATEQTPPDPNTYSQGVDADTGAVMKVYTRTVGRVRVDVCGHVIQGWQVQLSFANDGTGDRQSTYTRPQVRSYTVSGTFVFAPQLALIVAEDLTFVGMDVGSRPYRLHSRTTLHSTEPL